MNINKNVHESEPLPPETAMPTPSPPASAVLPMRRKSKRRRVQVVGEYHDISTAIKMAIFLPGAGQIYNGQILKGILLVVLTFAGLFGATFYTNRATLLLGGPGEVVLWLGGIFDAGIIARRLRHRQVVSVWKWF